MYWSTKYWIISFAAWEKAFELLKQKYEPLMNQLKAYVCRQAELEEVKPDDHPLFRYVTRLVAHIKSLPTIGFNSGNYDINLTPSHLVKSLMQNGEKIIVTKRGNKFLSLSTSSLNCLDICSYLPPGASLAAYVQMFGCKLQKFFFSYGWMTSPEKLKETQLPPAQAFYNDLKCKEISDEEYQLCHRVSSMLRKL